MKILVISLAGIGDTLFTTPLIHELRANYADAEIDALVLWPGSRHLLDGNPYLSSVYQRNFLTENRLQVLRFLWRLRKRSYDISLNTHPQSRVHYRAVARLINARLRVSHRYDQAGSWERLLVNRTIPQDYSKHAVENNLALLELLGRNPQLAQHEYEIYLSDADTQWAAGFLAQHKWEGRRMLGVHIGSGGTKNLALRRWPREHYLALFQKLRQYHPDLGIVLLGGPEEQNDHRILQEQTSRAQVVIAPTANLRQAAALIKRCDLFLSVDTNLMHLAAAVKVPHLVVIETPTWNKPIEPYAHPFCLIRNPAVAGKNLQYYRYDGRGIQGSAEEITSVMRSVTVDSVLRTLQQKLLANV